MSLFDLLIIGALIAFVVALLHANNVLGNNPHQQVKAHEDLVGNFPTKMSFAEKLRLINMFGISPANPRRTWWVAAVVAAFIFALSWLRQ